MYSVVLMAALTTGMDLPDRHGCHGCRGGCYGGGYGGGYGYGCCGCYGGGYGGGMGYGGCMGMGMGYGGCYGGMGMGMGCGGGYGGCMGMGMGYGGCMGMGYGGCMGMGMGCGGGYGGFGLSGGVILQGGTTQQGEKAPTPKEKREESLLPAPVTIVVDLPADAKLFIDNEATTSTGGSRVFQSPTLNPGKEYQYTLTAQVVRDGKPVKAEQVVAVRAGQTIPVRLTLPTRGVAQR